MDNEDNNSQNVIKRRVLGAIIDILLLLPVGVLILFFFVYTNTLYPGLNAVVYTFGIFLLILFLYTSFLEGRYGKTLGKAMTRIKVSREGRSECGYKASFIRNIFRIIIDGLFFYIIGFVFLVLTSKNKRIGDLVAKTRVSKE